MASSAMEEIILKYLKNDLSDEEARQLHEWLAQDPVNRAAFENIAGQWKLKREDVLSAKQRVWKNITPDHRVSTGISGFRKYAILAAIVVFTCLAGLSLLLYDSISGKKIVEIEKETMRGQKISFALPDGSRIKLNAASKLTYDATFSQRKRSVKLEGEAFFEVAHNVARPFQVTVNGMTIEVLGTSFNVQSYPEDSTILVAVRTGTVGVSSLAGDHVKLHAGEMLNQIHSTLLKKDLIKDDQVAFGWTEQKLVFGDTPIAGIVVMLSRWYDVDFNLTETVDRNKRFTGSYKNQTLEQVMESLSYALNIRYTIKDGIVTITS